MTRLTEAFIAANRFGLGLRPGLKPSRLYEARDLRPTTDLRALFKAALRDHLGVDAAALDRDVFPDSLAVPPLDGLFSAWNERPLVLLQGLNGAVLPEVFELSANGVGV